MALYLTYTHVDSDGLGTLVQVNTGMKTWVLSRREDLIYDVRNRSQLSKVWGKMGADTVSFKPKVHRYLVHAYPGDIVIQGPTQHHEVYTPIPSIATGAHFYTLWTMHLTEPALLHANQTENKDSNFSHPSVQITLPLLLNTIKTHQACGEYDLGACIVLNDTDVLVCPDFPRKSIAALCRIVLRPTDYFKQKFDDAMYFLRQANHIRGATNYSHAETTGQFQERMPQMLDIVNAQANARYLQDALHLPRYHDYGDGEAPGGNMGPDSRSHPGEDLVLKDGLYDCSDRVDITKEIKAGMR